MALRNLEVLIKVRDDASKKLDGVGQKVRRLGSSVKRTSSDFTQFNRTLFSTTAFVGTFIGVISKLSRTFETAGNLDRLSNQFERLFGPKQRFTSLLKDFTTTSIDEFSAMEQAISLKSLGIAGSLEETTSIIGRAGTAAKLAGKDSGEGVKAYTAFLKDGSTSHLQFLNLIAQTNPALQAQMAVLQKTTGIMGTVVGTQQRLAIGQKLLNAATEGQLKGAADLADTYKILTKETTMLRGEFGRFLFTALAPFISKLTSGIESLRNIIDGARKTEKHILFLTKAVVLSTGAFVGFIATLGTLRLAAIALSSVGLGLPRLIFLGATLGATFLGITNKADSVIQKFRVFGAFIKGVSQLISTFNDQTGKAFLDIEIEKLLGPQLTEFAKQVARTILVVKTVANDIVTVITNVGKKLSSIFSGIGNTITDFIAGFSKPWENWWVNKALDPVEKFKRGLVVIGAAAGAIFSGMILKAITGRFLGATLGKLPIIGKFFGATAPKGTKSDPMWIKSVDKIAEKLLPTKFTLSALFGGIFTLFKTKILNVITSFQILSGTMTPLRAGLIIVSDVVKVLGKIGSTILVFGASIIGAIEGILITADDWKKFFVGLVDITRAGIDVFSNWISGLVESIPFLKEITSTLKTVATGLFDVGKFLLIEGPLEIISMIKEGFKIIFGTLGIQLGEFGTKFSEFARRISPETFKEETPTLGLVKPLDTPINTAGGLGDKTNVTIPEIEQEDLIGSLGEHLKTLSGAEQKRAQRAVEMALESTSEKGAQITPDELQRILGGKMEDAIDFLKGIEENTSPIRGSGALKSKR